MKPASILSRLEERGFFHIKPGLGRIRRVLTALGHPENHMRAIHIAGTNGKGSVAAMLESVLRKAGYRTGLYTSPHLLDVTERIQINRQPLPRTDFSEMARLVFEAEQAAQINLTYFEFTTVMAFIAFSRARTQVAIVEVGMGGLWDATNVLKHPLLTVITSIGLDHQKWLGRTEEKIVAHKAGIVKKNVPLVSGVRGVGKAVIAATARRKRAPLYQIDDDFRVQRRSTHWDQGRQLVRYSEGVCDDYAVALLGAHQADNAAVALCALFRLREAGLCVPEAAIRGGLRDVKWAGRLECIVRANEAPLLLDGAHNPAGTQALLQALQDSPFHARRKILVFGAYGDKDIHEMARQWRSRAQSVHLVGFPGERGTSRSMLRRVFRTFQGPVKTHATTNEALRAAFQAASAQDVVIVSGSLRLVGEVLGSTIAQPKGISTCLSH